MLGIIPWAPSHAYANRGWEPSLNAAQPHAKAEGCVLEDLQADKLRKGWVFRVGTWSIDSLKGRAGELGRGIVAEKDWCGMSSGDSVER